jgi:hypothetical protein
MRSGAARSVSPAKLLKCEPFSKILVASFATGSRTEHIKCKSDAPFLVHCLTNGQSYGVSVESTGAGGGANSPFFTIGGVAGDVVTITVTSGAAGFLTLQTMCSAKASITRSYS